MKFDTEFHKKAGEEGFKGAIHWAPIVSKDASLSDNKYEFFPVWSGIYPLYIH